MTQTHLLHSLGHTFWLFPIKANGASCLHGTEATTARADSPQDHESGRFMTPTLTNIGAAGLFTHGVQFLSAHEVLQIFVVFSLGRAHSQPFRTAFWNDGCHGWFLAYSA